MLALFKRNLKIYFANKPSAFLSCLAPLISFLLYICFLKQTLTSDQQTPANITEIMDLWMTSGTVAVAAITISFQSLGQLVKDRESRTWDDLQLTDLKPLQIKSCYLLAAIFISSVMQIIVFVIMLGYFMLSDKIKISPNILLPTLTFIILGAISASSANLIIVDLVYSSTTLDRLSAVLGAASGFMVATYMPYGSLTESAKFVVKLFPGSYEAASLRSILLNDLNGPKFPSHLTEFLGIHFKINGHQLTNYDNAIIIAGMSIIFMMIFITINNKYRKKS